MITSCLEPETKPGVRRVHSIAYIELIINHRLIVEWDACKDGGAVFAPEGRRDVVTGGAKFAGRRTERNPWKDGGNACCPGGAEEGRLFQRMTIIARSNSFAPPGRSERRAICPRVARRPKPRRSTRGYIPSPLWGDQSRATYPIPRPIQFTTDPRPRPIHVFWSFGPSRIAVPAVTRPTDRLRL